jgi:hypothetical protein
MTIGDEMKEWHGMAWNGMAWNGMAWYGMEWKRINERSRMKGQE